MTKTKQVFISHATEDAEFAHRLADDLKRSGVQVWITPESIRPGESWVSAIERGLEESSHVVVVLTPAALESLWVKKETDIAIAREREGRIQVIPLNVEPSAAPPFLSSYQMVPFRSDYGVGLSQLAEILGIRIPPEPATAPTPARPALPWKWVAGGGAVVVVVVGLVIALVSGGRLPVGPTAATLAPSPTPTPIPASTPTHTPITPIPTSRPTQILQAESPDQVQAAMAIAVELNVNRVMERVKQAIQERRKVYVRYRPDPQGPVETYQVAPLDVKPGKTPATRANDYLWVYSYEHGSVISLRLGRVLGVELSEETFDPVELMADWQKEPEWNLPREW